MAEDTEAHLREHAKYFDGLLSLIPAKLYFGEDTSDQWQRKKQTKAQAKASKRAKLDPHNAKSAKDVLDENARKRKRTAEDEEQSNTISKLQRVTPKLSKDDQPTKKQNVADTGAAEAAKSTESTLQKVKAEAAQSKRERKRAADLAREEKSKSKTEKRKIETENSKEMTSELLVTTTSLGIEEVTGHFEGLDAEMAPRTLGLDEPTPGSVISSHSPIFDANVMQSGTSSISSFPDPIGVTAEKPPASSYQPKKPSQEELKLRLQKRLEELRAARKANKEDGTPARTRQELIEERRKKDEERKARKKALRKQQKEEERLKKEEEMARGSPLMSPAIRSPAGKHGLLPMSDQPNNFFFGKIAFENGQTMTADLEKILDPHKKKGPKDPKRALEAAEQRQEKLDAMDAEKRADILEKDMWLNAKKRAHGERVKDDTSLLKKALKRKERQKKKSGKEWDARIEGVKKGQEARQQQREENIQKRKDERANKGRKKGHKSKAKARPGFEGSFRTGSKRK